MYQVFNAPMKLGFRLYAQGFGIQPFSSWCSGGKMSARDSARSFTDSPIPQAGWTYRRPAVVA